MEALPTAEQANDWLHLAERWGWPSLGLAVTLFIVGYVIRVLWLFFKPNVQNMFDDERALVHKVSESVGVIVEYMKAGSDVDAKTHAKLDAIHDDVKVLVKRDTK